MKSRELLSYSYICEELQYFIGPGKNNFYNGYCALLSNQQLLQLYCLLSARFLNLHNTLLFLN